MSQHIAIVGGGVIGLTCGIRLREAGHRVTIFAERLSPDTTSDRAGAVFTPFRIEGHPGAARWTKDSCAALSEIAASPAGADAGVRMTPFREYFFTPQPDRPWWAELVAGYHNVSPIPPPYAAAVGAVVPRMSMMCYMPWLMRRFRDELGGNVVCERVGAFEEVFARGFRCVVNCSGLGARELAHDSAVLPMRGQVMHVANEWGLTECLVEEGRGEATTYVFPFDEYVVLGGTYERGQWSAETHEPALAAVVDRCNALLVASGRDGVDLRTGRRLRSWAGLRPARMIGGIDEAVRLETERRGGDRVLVHNYGHGRAGVTLSWGCAADVLQRIGDAFRR